MISASQSFIYTYLRWRLFPEDPFLIQHMIIGTEIVRHRNDQRVNEWLAKSESLATKYSDQQTNWRGTGEKEEAQPQQLGQKVSLLVDELHNS